MFTTSQAFPDWLKENAVRVSSGCVEWKKAIDRQGYGRIKQGGKTYLAHRVSYQLSNGYIPCGLFVCHKCDNRKCVNPAHLFLGTHLDNMCDMRAKNRRFVPLGDFHGRSKLDERKAWLIRRFLERHPHMPRQLGSPYPFLASWFGVGTSAIYSVHVNRTWKHVA